jgi:hypothetical protein
MKTPLVLSDYTSYMRALRFLVRHRGASLLAGTCNMRVAHQTRRAHLTQPKLQCRVIRCLAQLRQASNTFGWLCFKLSSTFAGHALHINSFNLTSSPYVSPAALAQ